MNDWPYTICVGALLGFALLALWVQDARVAPTLALLALSWVVLVKHRREAVLFSLLNNAADLIDAERNKEIAP